MADHDHYGDYAGERHRHYDLERDDETAQRDIRRLQEDVRELRALIEDAVLKLAARVGELEAQTPQAQRLQHEADLAAADLAESGCDRHGSHCECPYCRTDEPELTGPDVLPADQRRQALRGLARGRPVRCLRIGRARAGRRAGARSGRHAAVHARAPAHARFRTR